MMNPNIDTIIRKYYSNHGYLDTLRFIFHSTKVPFLNETIDISKTLELVSMPKGKKTLVEYLKLLQDTNPSIVLSYNNYKQYKVNDGTNDQKLSTRRTKYLNSKLCQLNETEFNNFLSLIGLQQLNRDRIQSKDLEPKLQRIKALYTAKIPSRLLNFQSIRDYFDAEGITVSEEDLIAFFSLISDMNKKPLADGQEFYISASLWESIFGRRNIKLVKRIFHKLNVLSLKNNGIPGYRSSRFIFHFNFDKSDDLRLDQFPITSIRTLEKINRIKKYKSEFTLNKRIQALRILSSLSHEYFNDSNNLTKIFLLSGDLNSFINDIKTLSSIIDNDLEYVKAKSLSIHLQKYINSLYKPGSSKYYPFKFLTEGSVKHAA